MDYIHGINVGNTTYGVGLPNFYINDKGNLNIETSAEIGNTPDTKGKINIEANSDIQLKPGDDITLYSHHRESGKQNEVAIKVLNGLEKTEYPVQLQVNASDIVLTTKDKTGTNANVMDVAINTGKKSGDNPVRGYLKVRAQAIDLRCENHGGIAIQPKGYDDEGHMNKIKFEHGGGDGLEFGTFNTEKASLFTDEYRFNKDGVWKMATRETTPSGKTIRDEGDIPVGKQATGALKYVKQGDDFYDIIAQEDEQCTTKDIIKTAYVLNTANGMSTEMSGSGNCKITAADYYTVVLAEDQTTDDVVTFALSTDTVYEKDLLKEIYAGGDVKASDYIGSTDRFKISNSDQYYVLSTTTSPKITISSGSEVGIESKLGDVAVTFGDCMKCEGPEIRLNAMNADKTGGMVNFGSTAEVMFLEKKFTKSGNVEAPESPTEVKLATYNNSWKTIYWDETNLVFRRNADVIYTDPEHTTLYDPQHHVKETPIYFSDGTLVPEDTTCFVRKEVNGDINVYKVSTKGSSAILSKSNDLIAIISNGNYLRQLKSDGVTPYCADLIVEADNWTPVGLTEVAPQGYVLSTSCLVEDIVKFVAWAKTNNEGPWAL